MGLWVMACRFLFVRDKIGRKAPSFTSRTPRTGHACGWPAALRNRSDGGHGLELESSLEELLLQALGSSSIRPRKRLFSIHSPLGPPVLCRWNSR
jgi:hypothetical protein